MCTVTLNINEAQLRELNPSLTDMASINRWAQQQMDNLIEDLVDENKFAKEHLKPYTVEELNERIEVAERESAAGLGKDFDDFMNELEEELAEEERKETEVLVEV